MKIRTIISSFNRTIGFTSLLLVVFSAGFFLWLHTGSGLNWLEKKIRDLSNNKIQIEGLTGRLPTNLRGENLVLRDNQHKVWLTAQHFEFHLDLTALIFRNIHLRQVDIKQVTMFRPPSYSKTSKTTGQGNRTTRSYLKSILVDEVHIRSYLIETNVAIVEFTGEGSGSIKWEPGHGISISARSKTTVKNDIPLLISGDLTIKHGKIAINQLTASNSLDHISVSGDLIPSSRMFRITADFACADAARYQSLFKQPVHGAVAGKLDLIKSRRDDPFRLLYAGHSDQITYRNFKANSLTSSGELVWATSGFAYRIDATTQSGKRDNLLLDVSSFHGSGNKKHLTFKVSTSGKFVPHHDFQVEADAIIELQSPETGFTFKVKSAEGVWNDQAFKIDRESSYTRSPSASELHIPLVRLGEVHAKADAWLQNDMIDRMDLTLQHVELSDWAHYFPTNIPLISGTLNLSAQLENLILNPTGKAMLKIEHAEFDHGIGRHFDGSNLEVSAEIQNNALKLQGEATHPLLNHLAVYAGIPLIHTNTVVPVTMDRDKSLEASISMSASLKELGQTIITSPMAIGGNINVDLKVMDLLARPEFQGGATMTNGQFRSLLSGTFLDNIQLVFTGHQNRLILHQASATDGGKGSISASGDLVFEHGWIPFWDIKAHLTNASLFRLIQTELPLTGELQAVHTNQLTRLDGTLYLEPFRFVIPRRLPPNMPKLDIVEINHPDQSRNTAGLKVPEETGERSNGIHDASLNVRVKTRNTFEVTGRGLQSEWKGEMTIEGTLLRPHLTGSARITRGYAMLLGRRFNIDNGNIQLTGEIPPNPRIDASASTRISETIARIVVTGTVGNPTVLLTSDPMLPDDEIMAMILFGKSVETMSPWQALALANGLRIISGGNDLVDVIYESQSLLNVDQIDIKQDEEGEGFSSVTIGKYIGSKLYVEGEKGFGDAEDNVTVTLELSPRLILQTEASPRIREGISLIWRRDF